MSRLSGIGFLVKKHFFCFFSVMSNIAHRFSSYRTGRPDKG
jgi:hypothetical protein